MAFGYMFYVSSAGRESLYTEMIRRGDEKLKDTILTAWLAADEATVDRAIEHAKWLERMKKG